MKKDIIQRPLADGPQRLSVRYIGPLDYTSCASFLERLKKACGQ